MIPRAAPGLLSTLFIKHCSYEIDMEIIILVGMFHVGATRLDMLAMAWPSLDFLSLQLSTKPIEDSNEHLVRKSVLCPHCHVSILI